MSKDESVLVLLGGDSPEREVSLRSGQAVYDALIELGYKAEKYDPYDGLGKLKEIAKSYDVVLPILHGKNGEDGIIQAELEKIGVNYLGTDSKHSAECFNKDISHKILESNGVHMPKSQVINKYTFEGCHIAEKPFVLKPIDGGSSVDTIIVRDINNLSRDKILDAFSRHNELLIEELIEGLEITVPILSEEVLSVIAILPPQGAEFDYENKYNGKSQEICPVPINMLSEDLQNKAQELALRVHKILNARHLSRVDMIYSDSGEFVVLELNTIPGLTKQSLFPNSAKVAGYDMKKLVDEFVKLALGDK